MISINHQSASISKFGKLFEINFFLNLIKDLLKEIQLVGK